MNCPKCHKEFERRHHRQKYCDECRGVTPADETVIPKRGDTQLQEKYDESAKAVGLPPDPVCEYPLGPLDVYAPERWSKLQSNYEFDPALGRARCKEMSSNIAHPSPGDPAYSDTPSGDEMLTFNDLPLGDRSTIERESNDGDPERTREVLIECALKYHKIFGNAHAHEFKR